MPQQPSTTPRKQHVILGRRPEDLDILLDPRVKREDDKKVLTPIFFVLESTESRAEKGIMLFGVYRPWKVSRSKDMDVRPRKT